MDKSALSLPERQVRDIVGVQVRDLTQDQAVSLLDHSFDGAPRAVAFANANLLYLASNSPSLRQILQPFLVLNDGLGADLASRILYGAKFRANLNGTDFVPYFLARTSRSLRIFMLGGRAGVTEVAANRLASRFPQHQFVGTQHGYFAPEDEPLLLQRIRASSADVVLVALGNPQQEQFLAQHLAASGCQLAFGVGALFDFLSGTMHRAPRWMQKWRLEWAFRLALEPVRLFRRYCVEAPVFLARVVRQRRS